MAVKPDYSKQVQYSIWNEKKQEHDDFYTVQVAVGDWVWAEYNMGTYDEDHTVTRWGTPVLVRVEAVTVKGFVIPGFGRVKKLTVDPATGFSKDRQVRVRMRASAEELAARDAERAADAERKREMEQHQAQPSYKVANYITGFGAYSPEQLLKEYGFELLDKVARQLGYKETGK